MNSRPYRAGALLNMWPSRPRLCPLVGRQARRQLRTAFFRRAAGLQGAARIRAVRVRARRSAFTLFEVLLVIVLVAVLAAVAWPTLSGSGRAENLDESVGRFKALIAMCRAQSMNESRSHRIVFRVDGTISVRRQIDAIEAPHQFVPVQDPWGRQTVLLDDVWIDGVIPLPEGPPPLNVQDDLIEFAEFDELPRPIAEIEGAVQISFRPDGSSESLRWIVRDGRGRGVEMTLDGRLGNVFVAPAASLSGREIARPRALDKEAERKADEELLALEKEFKESRQ